jgi:EAL and modified HD-GYP domain-containing signal transduction protein
MFGWLKQLIGVGAPAPARAPKAATPATPPGNPPEAAAGFGLQRPLVGAGGRVTGYEFQLPPAVARRVAERADIAAHVSHLGLLLWAMRPALAQGRQAVAEVPAAALARPALADRAPAGAWLCVTELDTLPADVAQALRTRGVRLGVPDGPPASAPAADFVWLKAAGGDADTVLLSAQRWTEARPRLPVVATGLAAVDDIERAVSAGCTLVGGQLSRRRSASTKPINAAAHRICELMNHLALNRDTAVVADAVRADVALSYRLLRYANSPALGLSRSVESVEQAVLILGRQELSRWLSMLLMASAASRQAAAALQEQALARGRLLELLARAAREPVPEALFSVGLFSMLEALLQTPLAQALAPLRLSASASQALLQDQGPWAHYLQMAVALDAGDSAQTEALAQRWEGGIEAVQAASEAAWAWAAAVTDSAGAESKKPVA